MAVYDPYSNDNDPSYYQPATIEARTGGGSTGIGGMVKSMAFGFAAQAVMHAGLHKAVSMVGKQFAKGQAAYAKNQLASSAKFSTQKTDMYKRLSKAKTGTDVMRARFKSVDKTYRTLNKNKAYNDAYLDKRKQKTQALAKVNRIDAAKYRVTSAFESKKAFSIVAGNNFKKSVLAGSAIGYGYDAMTGQLGHMGVRDDLAWYDPRHATNYAKYMIKNAATFSAMGNIGLIGGTAKAGIAGTVRGFSKANTGFMNKVAENAAKLSNVKYKGAGKYQQQSHYKDINGSFQKEIDDSIFRAGDKAKDYAAAATSVLGAKFKAMTDQFMGYSPDRGYKQNKPGDVNFSKKVRSASQQIQQSFRRKQTERKARSTDVGDLGGFQELEAIQFIAKQQTKPNAKANPSPMNGALQRLLDGPDKASWTESMFGVKHVRMHDVLTRDHLNDIAHSTKHAFPDSTQEQLVGLLGQIRVGDQIYKADKFHVDMNKLNPVKVLARSMASMAKLNFKMFDIIPMIGKNLSISAIGQVDALMSQDIKAHTFTSQKQGFGGFVQTERGTRSLADVLESDLGITHENQKNGVAITFLNKRFYASTAEGITELKTHDHVVKNVSPSINGLNEFQRSDRDKALAQSVKSTTETKVSRDLVESFAIRREERFSGGVLSGLARAVDFALPAFDNLKNKMNNIMGATIDNKGRRIDYSTHIFDGLIETFSGGSTDFTKNEYLKYLSGLQANMSSDVYNVLSKPGAMRKMGMASTHYMKIVGEEFPSDVVAYSQRLRRTDGDTSGAATKLVDRLVGDNDETRALYNVVMNDPGAAGSHISRPRNGRMSDMTVSAELATREITIAAGLQTGEIHPFINGSEYLYQQGDITRSQRDSMQMYGFIDTIFSHQDTLFKGKMSNGTVETSAIQGIYKRNREAGLISLGEWGDHVRNNGMQAPMLTKSQTNIHQLIQKSSDDDRFGRSKDSTQLVMFGYSSDESKTLEIAGKFADVTTQRLTGLLGDVLGLQRNPLEYGNGWKGAAKFMATRGGQLAAATLAYKGLDAAVASSPIFDQTGADAGITGLLANAVAGTHLMSAAALNYTGLAGVGRHLDGLMPGFMSSAPGSIIGGAVRYGTGPAGMLGGMIRGAVTNRMLSAYMPDFTKTYSQLEAEYSGDEQVAMVKGRGWLLGTTPWQGNKVIGWKPNWFVEAQSRWKASDTLYGSEVRKLLHEPLPVLNFSIGDIVDPYYMERKHFHSRPYGETGGAFAEAPLGLGAVLDATIGKIIKPKKRMHNEYMQGNPGFEGNEVTAMPIPNQAEHSVFMKSAGAMNPRMGHNRGSFMGSHVYSSHGHFGQMVADDALSNMENAMGLVGFASKTARTKLVSEQTIRPTIETAGRMASMSRAYNDLNSGGLGTLSEAMRRFIYKKDYKEAGVNPIPNMLPNWLPARFLTGDPYEKIMKGEIRLPGRAYERTHETNLSMPGRASMFGGQVKDIVAYFTGFKSPLLKEEHEILETGTAFHENIQQWLKAENILISAENFVYDERNNISGHIDGVIQDGFGGGGRRALEIKSISEKGLKKLDGAKYQHVGQLNFYLHEMGMKKGTILYVSRDNPANFKVYEMDYSYNRYAKDLEKIQQARKIASNMLAQGKEGMSKGFSYSWVDRLKVLADVAPASKEFKEAKSVVQQQMKANMLGELDVKKYSQALKHREATIRTYELYPTRFTGQIMSPDAEYNSQNLNENMKAASEYSMPERVIGAAWERFTNTDTFLTNKFFAFKDPTEHYRQLQVLGKEFTPWDDPWGSFGQTRVNKVVGSTDPLRGAVTGAMDAGYLLGGRSMAVAGGIIGAATGLGNMVFRDKNYTPGARKKERQINDYFDTMKYYKNERMANLSEGMEYDRFKNASSATFHSLINNESTDYTNIYRASYDAERPYISAWLNETDTNKQQEILKSVPGRLGEVLKMHWQKEGSKVNTQSFIDKQSAGLLNNINAPRYDMRELDPGVMLEDTKLKAINNEGMNAHDFGLGWSEQLMRMQSGGQGIVSSSPFDVEYDNSAALDPGVIRSAIQNILSHFGVQGRVRVNINNHVSDSVNRVTLTIQHDRTQAIRSAVDFRRKFM